MKSKKYANNIMVAYIVFLVFALLLHLLQNKLKIDFDNWNVIVVATTISTIFFAVSSFCNIQSSLKREEIRIDEYNIEKINLLSDKFAIINDFITDKDFDKIAKDINEEYENEINENNKDIENLKEYIKIVNIIENVCDVLGFLSFFLIVTVNGLYLRLSIIQNELTIIAFIILLIGGFYSSRVVFMQEELRKENEKYFEQESEGYDRSIDQIEFHKRIIRDIKKRPFKPLSIDLKEDKDGQVENGD